MDPTVPQTSFIPKKPLADEPPRRSRPVGLLIFFATLLFFGSLASAAGVYLYRGVVTKQVTSMNAQLEIARRQFEPNLITDLSTLDRRIGAANDLLSQHTMVSPIFTALETLTLRTIRYTKFAYSTGMQGSKEVYNVSLVGQSSSGYAPIALQSDVFLQNKYIIDPLFSDLTVDDKGRVNFNLSFTVDPALVSYLQSVTTGASTDASSTSLGIPPSQ